MVFFSSCDIVAEELKFLTLKAQDTELNAFFSYKCSSYF